VGRLGGRDGKGGVGGRVGGGGGAGLGGGGGGRKVERWGELTGKARGGIGKRRGVGR